MENNLKIEKPYFDKFGKEIKEFAILKMFHFKGRNEQGRGRKNYYMYKQVRLKKYDTKNEPSLWWVGYHLTNNQDSCFTLKGIANEERIIESCEIVQQN